MLITRFECYISSIRKMYVSRELCKSEPLLSVTSNCNHANRTMRRICKIGYFMGSCNVNIWVNCYYVVMLYPKQETNRLSPWLGMQRAATHLRFSTAAAAAKPRMRSGREVRRPAMRCLQDARAGCAVALLRACRARRTEMNSGRVSFPHGPNSQV